MAEESRTVDALPLELRAAVGSVNEEDRTADLVFTTGADVMRRDWSSGERFIEKLGTKPSQVRLDRLNGGAPLLNSHASFDLREQFGVVVEGSAKMTSGEGRASVRFSKREDVEPFFRDVVDGVIRNVSVGYRVHRFEESKGKDGAPSVRTATDWEPFEVSMVPIPADAAAQFRENKQQTHECVIVTRHEEIEAMPDEPIQTTDTGGADPEPTRAADPAPSAPAPADRIALADAPSPDATAARTAERQRSREIRDLVRGQRLEESFADELVDAGISVADARVRIMERTAAETNDPSNDTRSGVHVEMGEDVRDRWLRGAENWLLQRGGVLESVSQHEGNSSSHYDPGEFRGLTLLDLARESLERAGVKWRGLSRMDLAGQAFIRSAGYQTTSDFANLLENVLNKTLRAQYGITPDTWSGWCGTTTANDFRTQNWYRLGSLAALETLTEGGEFRNATIGDAEKQTFEVDTRGNIIGITRKTIVNDDLGGLTRMASMLGRAAALTIESAAYTELALNSGLGPDLSDTNPLFDAAHSNLGAGAAITAAAIDADAAVMAAQTGPNGNEILDLRPSVLLVPRGLQGVANQINDSQFDPDGTKSNRQPNIVGGMFDRVIGTARLTGTRRYMFADPSVAPVMVVSFLEGEREPVIETQDGWRYDGVSLRARLDFGVDGVDFRGAVTDAGA